MEKPIIFLGTNPYIIRYKEICAERNFDIAGIIDNDYFGNTKDMDGIPIIGSEITADWNLLKTQYQFFIGTNPIPGVARNQAKRQMWIDLIKRHNLDCVNIIEPQCRIGSTVVLGKGIYIGYCASIASSAIIGDYCQIHSQAIIGHHCNLDENVILQRKSSVGGSIDIGKNAYISINSSILNHPDNEQRLSIGENAIIHPSLLIMRDVKENEIVSVAGRRIYESRTVE